ncbi:MAG: futalosine hydrolase [Bacteroidota bacterium]
MSAHDVLLVAATVPELRSCIPAAEDGFRPGAVPGIDTLVTGVGCTSTAFQLGRILSTHRYRLAIHIGLAGSFDPNLPPGTVAEVVSDGFDDLGADDHGRFLSVFELNLADPDGFPFQGGRLCPAYAGKDASWPCVSATTVQTAHGEAEQISRFVVRVQVALESMEGAAFVYACMLSGVPCRQIRAVSNRVEPRRRDDWKIPEALDALGRFVTTNRVLLFRT